MNRWEIEKKITMKALKDPTFKKKLLSQPKEALKECLKNEKGMNLSFLDKITIEAYEEKKNEWMISLPYVSEENRKLSDPELEKLFAAGDCCSLAWSQGPQE